VAFLLATESRGNMRRYKIIGWRLILIGLLLMIGFIGCKKKEPAETQVEDKKQSPAVEETEIGRKERVKEIIREEAREGENTIYTYKQNDKEIFKETFGKEGNLIKIEGEVPGGTFIAKSYYKNGKLKSEIPFKNGKRSGMIKHYYENGNLQVEAPWSDGKISGLSKSYYENGKLASEIPYIDGKVSGIFKRYHETGNLMGEWPYRDGKRSGIAKFYYKSGRLESEMPYSNDKINGTVKKYDEAGKLISEVLFKDGKEEVKGTKGAGIGVSRRYLMRRFEGLEIGFSSKEGLPVKGLENYVVSKRGITAQLLGPADNLSSASITVILGTDKKANYKRLLVMKFFATWVDKSSGEWFLTQVGNTTSRGLTKEYTNEKIFGQRVYKFMFLPQRGGNLYGLSIRPR